MPLGFNAIYRSIYSEENTTFTTRNIFLEYVSYNLSNDYIKHKLHCRSMRSYASVYTIVRNVCVRREVSNVSSKLKRGLSAAESTHTHAR